MRAQLIDLSKWNQGFDPGAVASEEGVVLDGAILRAGYGLMPDPLFAALVQAARPLPVRAAYHYFSSGSPWEAQAQFFLRQVAGKQLHFFVLDFESAYNSKSSGFALGAQKWLEFVADRTGRRVVLYTNPSIYHEWLSPYGDWMADWPLWIAQYPYPSWNEYLDRIRTQTTIQPWLPKGRKVWKLWQYSADGNAKGAEFGVKSRHVDLNVFNGTLAELKIWAAVDQDEHSAPQQPQKIAPVLDDMQTVIDRYRIGASQ